MQAPGTRIVCGTAACRKRPLRVAEGPLSESGGRQKPGGTAETRAGALAGLEIGAGEGIRTPDFLLGNLSAIVAPRRMM